MAGPSADTTASHATAYRTHTCAQLRADDAGAAVKLAGWVHTIRNHGGLIFVDLRDWHGITQCVVAAGDAAFEQAEALGLEDVVQVRGTVLERPPATRNPGLVTGDVEVHIDALTVLSKADMLPFQVNTDDDVSEELLLRYRYLAMRRRRLRDNLALRSRVVHAFREKLTRDGFVEMQTPLLTASSPEGARDFLVPSRLHPGTFFALPQSPQQFKQLLMIGGLERYFQIAPCLRDEAARADRSPAEHYQVDLEMAFVDRDDVFAAVERVVPEVFAELGGGRRVTPVPFPRIPHAEALARYGSDKPDLRNPLRIADVTALFERPDVTFNLFKNRIAEGAVVRAIAVPEAAGKPRSWYDRWTERVRAESGGGLAYLVLEPGNVRGPLARFFPPEALGALRETVEAAVDGSAVLFICELPELATKLGGMLRTALGDDLGLIDKNAFNFAWVVDFPMYERDEETGRIEFGHNPFSMPRGGMKALLEQDPLSVIAEQYDLTCNGYELCSGAVRNHSPEIMLKAFEIAGYTHAEVESKFVGMLTAFRFGAPPHAGCALGVDRIVMLLADEHNLRQVIAFPMNQQQQDLLMNAPSEVPPERLAELHIRTVPPRRDG
jgi:aspartyl-tRNA synthetase